MPGIDRIDFKGGGWAKVHKRPSHDQIIAVSKAHRANLKADTPEASIADVILLLTSEWEVKDEEGNPLPLSKVGIGAAPNEVVMDLTDRLAPLWNESMTPLARLRDILYSLDDDDPIRPKLHALVEESSGN
jgi:hypothetical protein